MILQSADTKPLSFKLINIILEASKKRETEGQRQKLIQNP